MNGVWIFNGDVNKFPSAVFSSYENAVEWISINKSIGTLTYYPVDISVYDWAVKNEYFKLKAGKQSSPTFISNFSSASQEHFRFEREDNDG
jgi:hypothetical protein